MNAQTPLPILDEPLADALAERLAETVYRRLRADVLMGDDMLVTEDEMAAIMHRNPEAMKTMARIYMGPQGVRIAGSRAKHYTVGAIRRYLSDVRAGAMHARALIEAQNEFDMKNGRLTMAE